MSARYHLPHSLSLWLSFSRSSALISLLSSSEFEELDLEDEEVQEAGEEDEEEPSQAEPPCSSDSLSPLLKTALTEVDRAIAIVTGRHGKQHPKYAQYSGGPTSIGITMPSWRTHSVSMYSLVRASRDALPAN